MCVWRERSQHKRWNSPAPNVCGEGGTQHKRWNSPAPNVCGERETQHKRWNSPAPNVCGERETQHKRWNSPAPNVCGERERELKRTQWPECWWSDWKGGREQWRGAVHWGVAKGSAALAEGGRHRKVAIRSPAGHFLGILLVLEDSRAALCSDLVDQLLWEGKA